MESVGIFLASDIELTVQKQMPIQNKLFMLSLNTGTSHL
jgi:hypothetical protein